MNLPSRSECFELLNEWHVPKHIIAHILKVNKVAVFLASKLKKKGIDVDLELIDRASLLHDILRVCNFRSFDPEMFTQKITNSDLKKWKEIRQKFGHMNHAEAGYELLKSRYPEVAEIVRKHSYSSAQDEKYMPKTWNEKVVFYADKRVLHDKVVTLKEKAEAELRKGAQQLPEDQSKKIDAKIKAIEDELFACLDITPDELLKLNDAEKINRAKDGG